MFEKLGQELKLFRERMARNGKAIAAAQTSKAADAKGQSVKKGTIQEATFIRIRSFKGREITRSDLPKPTIKDV
jgi:hypothetical protein